MKTFQISDDLHSDLSLALSCFLDDQENVIIKQEKKIVGTAKRARDLHSRIQKWLLTEFNPTALRGEMRLLNGEIIKPKEPQ